MENYPGNSNRTTAKSVKSAQPKPEKKTSPQDKKVEKVVVNKVTRRKKPLGKRFAETFVGGDAESVWTYVLNDVMVPAAKDMVADAVSQGIEKMLFGESRGRSRGARVAGAAYTSYNKISTQTKAAPRRDISQRARATHDFDEIILGTRGEAQEVLDQLYTLISEYDVATVADLYEMVDQTGTFTDEKWGWTSLRGAGITRVKGGYLLDLPQPVYID